MEEGAELLEEKLEGEEVVVATASWMACEDAEVGAVVVVVAEHIEVEVDCLDLCPPYVHAKEVVEMHLELEDVPFDEFDAHFDSMESVAGKLDRNVTSWSFHPLVGEGEE